jgi:hypothetical protein
MHDCNDDDFMSADSVKDRVGKGCYESTPDVVSNFWPPAGVLLDVGDSAFHRIEVTVSKPPLLGFIELGSLFHFPLRFN